MINHDTYAQILRTKTGGRARKMNADMIMTATWDGDIQEQMAYLYDMFHDLGAEHFKLDDLHPADDPNKTPIDIKFIRHSTQTYNKDPVTYWLQLLPGQKCNVDYYNEAYASKYGNIFPVGLYIDIMDESGAYNKWLVVNIANYDQNQFPTFELLRCDYVAQWVHKGHKYECPCVLQSQNSYNSGLWLDYKIQSVQDQQKFAAPLNIITETLFYNHRMIIDSALYNEDAEPRAWLISKVNRLSPDGIARITLAQDIYDQHKDYIERDENGKVIGMWADYWTSAVEPRGVPTDDDTSYVIATLTCSGKQQIRIGGSAKTFTVTYANKYGDDLPDHAIGTWRMTIDGTTVPRDLLDLEFVDNKMKLKFLGDDSFIGKVLTVTNTTYDALASVSVEIIGL